MDSSFLTGFHIGLGLFACILFLKLLIQFGLPNHPTRFISYIVSLCASAYFMGLAATDLGWVSPWDWIKWRPLPLIVGTLSLLCQTVMLAGNYSSFHQKILSRLPLMASLFCFAFFPSYADVFASTFLILGGVILLFFVTKARYQKRLYLKMLFFFLIHLGLNYLNLYPAYVVGQLLIFFMLLYVFLFEQSFALAALVDDFKKSLEGDPR